MVFGKKEVKENPVENEEGVEVKPKEEAAPEVVEDPVDLSASEKKRETWAANNAKNEKDRKAAWLMKQLRLGRMSDGEYKKALAELNGK